MGIHLAPVNRGFVFVDSKAITPRLQRVGSLAIWIENPVLPEAIWKHGLCPAIGAESPRVGVDAPPGPLLQNVEIKLDVVADQLVRRVDEEQAGIEVLALVGVFISGVGVDGTDTMKMRQRGPIPLVPGGKIYRVCFAVND